MGTRIPVLILVLILKPTMPLASSALAQSDAENAVPDDTRIGEDPSAGARGRGLTALNEGNFIAAAAAFREAADYGDVEAMWRLGDMTYAGQGVAQSYTQAVHWYCEAARLGNLDAVNRLETIELGSWSQGRNTKGWELACEQWLEPQPPPQPVQPPPTELAPDDTVELRPGPETDRETYAPLLWPGYRTWYAPGDPDRQRRRRPKRPQPPFHRPEPYSAESPSPPEIELRGESDRKAFAPYSLWPGDIPWYGPGNRQGLAPQSVPGSPPGLRPPFSAPSLHKR